jgi:hypothetical protein
MAGDEVGPPCLMCGRFSINQKVRYCEDCANKIAQEHGIVDLCPHCGNLLHPAVDGDPVCLGCAIYGPPPKEAFYPDPPELYFDTLEEAEAYRSSQLVLYLMLGIVGVMVTVLLTWAITSARLSDSPLLTEERMENKGVVQVGDTLCIYDLGQRANFDTCWEIRSKELSLE